MNAASTVYREHGTNVYMRNLQREVEQLLNYEGTGFPETNDLIIPCVCQSFDADIAQKIICETDIHDTEGTQTLSATTDIELFNNVVWGCSSSCCTPPTNFRNVALSKGTGRLISFADNHFQSVAAVTMMSQLDLGCLALWLSWHPNLFSDPVAGAG